MNGKRHKWDDPPVAVREPSRRVSSASLADNIVEDYFKEQQKQETTSKKQNNDVDIVWEPIPNSSQAFAVTTRAHHTLYHGARGPGKTAAQLFRYRMRVGLGYGQYWRGVIFDREFKNLGDLVAQSKRFFPQFDDGAVWLNSTSEYKWKWPTGEELLFRWVKSIDDYDKFHGHEYPFIGWNELTKYPTLEIYDKFMSVNRSSFMPEKHTPKININDKIVYNTPDRKPLPPIPLEIFSTTNPNGPGHNAAKKRFIDCAENGEVIKKLIKYFDPIKGKEIEVIRTQVAIFGSFYENPYLDPVYRAGLIEMCANDPHLKAAWIYGDWSVSSGGAIDDLWEPGVHIVERFKVPSGWLVDRSFDWGSSHPFAVVWWAEANGEEVELENGKKWCPQRGSLIAIEDYYGTESIGTNRGLKMSAKDIAINIKAIEKGLKEVGWISDKISAGPADNQIRNVTESDVDTIEYKMEQEDVLWEQSDKSPGSRINGLQLMRERLQASKTGERPAIYFMRNCNACIETLPSLPRDPDKLDDVDTDAEDHVWDAVRYRVLKGSNKWATALNLKWVT